MHPTRRKIEQAILGLIAEKDLKEVMDHLDECRICREVADHFQEFQAAIPTATEDDLLVAGPVATGLYRDACRGQIISLTPLPGDLNPEELCLAADGQPARVPEIEELATLASEASDLVLRLMHDHAASQDFLQLVAEDYSEIAHTLVQIPSMKCEFVTDDKGRADLPPAGEITWDKVDWQIKMPEAVFDLKPLEFTPDQPDYSHSVELDTEQADRIRVTFEGRDDSCSIVVEVLELRGETDLAPMQAIVTAGSHGHSVRTITGQPIVLDLLDSDTPITIRLYRVL
jgi:hypothetical protein